MTAKITAFICVVGLITPVAAQSNNEPLRLKASSPWNVDYATDRCRLMRKFGEGEELVFAIFDRYGPGERFRMTIAGKPLKTAVEEGEATVQFGPTESVQKLAFFKGNLGEYPALVFQSQTRVAPPSLLEMSAIDKRKDDEWIELSPVGPQREGAIRYMTIGKPLRRAVVMETGPMRKSFEALNTCVDNLMASWGIDVEKHKTLTREAKPAENPERWVVSADYPLKMLSAAQPAIVEFRLSVGIDGKPTACHIQSTTRPKEFDNAVCKSVMRRAQLDPALDSEGKPIASFYRNTVSFRIP